MAFLIPVNIASWDTKHPGRRDQALLDIYCLNTNRMCNIVATDAGSRFFFNNDPDDRRDSPDRIDITSSVAVVTGWADFGYGNDSKYVTLPVFPGTDLTETPVDTTIEWDDIAYIWQTPKAYIHGVTHVVYYRNAWDRVECVIDKYLWEFFAYEWLGIWP